MMFSKDYLDSDDVEKYYIGTAWILTSMVGAVEGDAGLSRHIFRIKTTSPEMFKAEVRDMHLHDVDCEIYFGPIGISKNQNTPDIFRRRKRK